MATSARAEEASHSILADLPRASTTCEALGPRSPNLMLLPFFFVYTKAVRPDRELQIVPQIHPRKECKTGCLALIQTAGRQVVVLALTLVSTSFIHGLASKHRRTRNRQCHLVGTRPCQQRPEPCSWFSRTLGCGIPSSSAVDIIISLQSQVDLVNAIFVILLKSVS